MINSTDRRVRKTEESLKKCLSELMRTKSINEIKVADLAEKADINRSTFYLHYRDVFDLVEHIENNLINKISLAFEELEKNRISGVSLLDFLDDVFTVVSDNSLMFSALLNKNGDINFQHKIKNFLRNKTKNITKQRFVTFLSDNHISLISDYCISGVMGIAQTWISNPSLGSCHDMAVLSYNIIENGINGFMGKEL